MRPVERSSVAVIVPTGVPLAEFSATSSVSAGSLAVNPACVVCSTVRSLPLTVSGTTPAVEMSLKFQSAMRPGVPGATVES